MGKFFEILLLVAGGYVLSVYTWSWLKLRFVSAKAEAEKLKQRAAVLEQQAKDQLHRW